MENCSHQISIIAQIVSQANTLTDYSLVQTVKQPVRVVASLVKMYKRADSIYNRLEERRLSAKSK